MSFLIICTSWSGISRFVVVSARWPEKTERLFSFVPQLWTNAFSGINYVQVHKNSQTTDSLISWDRTLDVMMLESTSAFLIFWLYDHVWIRLGISKLYRHHGGVSGDCGDGCSLRSFRSYCTSMRQNIFLQSRHHQCRTSGASSWRISLTSSTTCSRPRSRSICSTLSRMSNLATYLRRHNKRPFHYTFLR